MIRHRAAGIAALVCVGGIVLPGIAAERQIDLSAETIWAADITLAQVAASWRETGARGGYDVSVAHTSVDLDYVPVAFDFRGESQNRREGATALQGAWRQRFGESWTVTGLGGVYRGFTNYRSVWLDEYFRQQYAELSSAGLDTYRKAEPGGANVGAGARWEYLPASGFAEFTVTWLSDRVSPGYEIDFDGLTRGSDTLNGLAAELKFENVLTPRIRSQVIVRTAEVSERETRFSGEAAVNVALGETVILRLNVGGAMEDPEFDASFAGLVLDYEFRPGWAVFASGRIYRDSGEIENALLFTSAAPGLDSRQWGGGLRYDGEVWAGRFSVGTLRTDYESTNVNTDFFQNLYRDRDWTVMQLAATRRF